MIEVPCYDVYSVRVFAPLAANAAIQMTASRFSIGVRWDVNSFYHDDRKLSQEVNRSAFHRQILQIRKAVAVYSHCVSPPAIIHVNTAFCSYRRSTHKFSHNLEGGGRKVTAAFTSLYCTSTARFPSSVHAAMSLLFFASP